MPRHRPGRPFFQSLFRGRPAPQKGGTGAPGEFRRSDRVPRGRAELPQIRAQASRRHARAHSRSEAGLCRTGGRVRCRLPARHGFRAAFCSGPNWRPSKANTPPRWAPPTASGWQTAWRPCSWPCWLAASARATRSSCRPTAISPPGSPSPTREPPPSPASRSRRPTISTRRECPPC